MVGDPISVGTQTYSLNMTSFWGSVGQFGSHATTSTVRSLANNTAITNYRFADATEASNLSSYVTWTAGSTGGVSGPIQVNVTTDWQFCQEIRPKCVFTASLPGETNSTGDVRSALGFFQSHGIDPTYWAVGNEPDAWTHFNIPWASWKTSDASTPTATQYAKEVQTMVPIIRSYFPNAKVIGIENFECANDTWIRETELINGPNLTAVACHAYSANSADVAGAGLQQFYNVLLSTGNNLATTVPNAEAAVNYECSDCHTPVWVGENNAISGGDPSGNFNGYMASYPDFVLTGGNLMRAISAGVPLVQFFQFWAPNGGNYALVNGSVPVVRPAYDLFSYYARNISGGPDVSVYSTSLSPTVRPVFAQFLTNATTASLLVVNANATTSETVVLPANVNTNFGGHTYEWSNTTSAPVVASFATNPTSTWTLPPQTLLLVESSRVNAQDSSGSQPSQPTGGVPSNLHLVSVTDTQATVAWRNYNGTTWSVEVSYGTSCSAISQDLLAGPQTEANLTGLSPKTTYCVGVADFGPLGYGGTVYANFTTASTPNPLSVVPSGISAGPIHVDLWQVVGALLMLAAVPMIYARRWPGAILVALGLALLVFA